MDNPNSFEESLNQRSYLLNILVELCPAERATGNLWNFTGTITEKQYKRYLALYFNGKKDEVVADVENYIKRTRDYDPSNNK